MTWSQLPPMPTARDRTQAGLVTYPNGDEGILVAGGTSTTSSEFLNLETLVWEPKANLPKQIHLAASVPYLDSFLIVGGAKNFNEEFYDSIFYYNPSNNDWDLLEQTLMFGRDQLAAFLVPDSFNPCS